MSRIKDLQKQVYKILEKMDDPEKQMKAMSHLHGVALAAAVLAKKRGEDAELATMAGMMHDLHTNRAAMTSMRSAVRSSPERFSKSWI